MSKSFCGFVASSQKYPQMRSIFMKKLVFGTASYRLAEPIVSVIVCLAEIDFWKISISLLM